LLADAVVTLSEHVKSAVLGQQFDWDARTGLLPRHGQELLLKARETPFRRSYQILHRRIAGPHFGQHRFGGDAAIHELGEAASVGPTRHVLDWFHLAMRIQHVAQAARNWPDTKASFAGAVTANIDVTVARVSTESETPAGNFLVEIVKHDVA
jgi:hypothetical protein